MDLTALVRVLRNTVLVEPLSGFRYYPPHYGISFGADVVRIHMSRNILSHTDFGKLKEEECENMSRMLIEVRYFPTVNSLQTILYSGLKLFIEFYNLSTSVKCSPVKNVCTGLVTLCDICFTDDHRYVPVVVPSILSTFPGL